MKYLIGLIVSILVIIFIIIKLISGGGNAPAEQPKRLADYGSTSTTVRYSIDNPVQAPENHRHIQITVGRDIASLDVLKGYDGEVINSRSYDMTQAAYTNFLFALDRTGQFTAGNDDDSVRDERGYCATGDRFTYEVIDPSGTVLQHYWSTSCKEKTFKGNISAVRTLFESQIPDFNDLTAGVDY